MKIHESFLFVGGFLAAVFGLVLALGSCSAAQQQQVQSNAATVASVASAAAPVVQSVLPIVQAVLLMRDVSAAGAASVYCTYDGTAGSPMIDCQR
jgi:hypothetical protein